MKKEKSQPQEILISYEAGRMLFSVGGQGFCLSEETAKNIFGGSVGLAFERVHSTDENFGGLRSLPNFVLISRLMRKGLSLEAAAKVLGHPQERVRAFYSREMGCPRVESWDSNIIENERKRQAELEMDFVKEAPGAPAMNELKPQELRERFVDLAQVKNLQRQGKTNYGIAEFLGLDWKEFEKFLEKNARYLALMP